MKIGLGTAQFGMKYGVTNSGLSITDDELGRILDLSLAHGVQYIDTAVNYGESEKRLGKFDLKNFRVVTKLPCINNADRRYSDPFALVEESLNRLGLSQLHGLMLHRPENLFESVNSSLWQRLNSLVEQNIVTRIGYSVYFPDELERLVDYFPPSIVQYPSNIIDTRFLEENWDQKLAKIDCEQHVRSIFLQGLLLADNPVKVNPFFNHWSKLFQKIDQEVRRLGVSRASYCMAGIYSKIFDGIFVIGAQNYSQWSEILNESNNRLDFPVTNFSELVSEDLVIPSRWRLV